ncbi:type II toxin-antitoxin system mRNA interferase toxin, RelE/StbE family [Candidatus Kaiserbacteria bacterium]|nr:type II toxin-antitoxin system mRNA interferase toxin, RelE/StbE family [Candidatus Kaiserbacteria bacterium]
MELLPEQYKDHQLHGDLAHFRECHIGFNQLLLYERDEALGIIVISKIGTHAELFGE